jgi:hypothetical protein
VAGHPPVAHTFTRLDGRLTAEDNAQRASAVRMSFPGLPIEWTAGSRLARHLGGESAVRDGQGGHRKARRFTRSSDCSPLASPRLDRAMKKIALIDGPPLRTRRRTGKTTAALQREHKVHGLVVT